MIAKYEVNQLSLSQFQKQSTWDGTKILLQKMHTKVWCPATASPCIHTSFRRGTATLQTQGHITNIQPEKDML